MERGPPLRWETQLSVAKKLMQRVDGLSTGQHEGTQKNTLRYCVTTANIDVFNYTAMFRENTERHRTPFISTFGFPTNTPFRSQRFLKSQAGETQVETARRKEYENRKDLQAEVHHKDTTAGVGYLFRKNVFHWARC